jgi:molybdopterin converting factor small subunit
MKVLIPGALRSYTESGETEASGATLAAVLADLERQYPGIRFRRIGYVATSASSSTAIRCMSLRIRSMRATKW